MQLIRKCAISLGLIFLFILIFFSLFTKISEAFTTVEKFDYNIVTLDTKPPFIEYQSIGIPKSILFSSSEQIDFYPNFGDTSVKYSFIREYKGSVIEETWFNSAHSMMTSAPTDCLDCNFILYTRFDAMDPTDGDFATTLSVKCDGAPLDKFTDFHDFYSRPMRAYRVTRGGYNFIEFCISMTRNEFLDWVKHSPNKTVEPELPSVPSPATGDSGFLHFALFLILSLISIYILTPSRLEFAFHF